MSRTRIVKGNITKIIGGNYKIYSKDNIENNASKVIQIGKEGGVSYGEPEKFLPPETEIIESNYSLESTYIHDHLKNVAIDIVSKSNGDNAGIIFQIYKDITEGKILNPQITVTKTLHSSKAKFDEKSQAILVWEENLRNIEKDNDKKIKLISWLAESYGKYINSIVKKSLDVQNNLEVYDYDLFQFDALGESTVVIAKLESPTFNGELKINFPKIEEEKKVQPPQHYFEENRKQKGGPNAGDYNQNFYEEETAEATNLSGGPGDPPFNVGMKFSFSLGGGFTASLYAGISQKIAKAGDFEVMANFNAAATFYTYGSPGTSPFSRNLVTLSGTPSATLGYKTGNAMPMNLFNDFSGTGVNVPYEYAFSVGSTGVLSSGRVSSDFDENSKRIKDKYNSHDNPNRHQILGGASIKVGNFIISSYNDIFLAPLFLGMDSDQYWSAGVNIQAKLTDKINMSYAFDLYYGKSNNKNPYNLDKSIDGQNYDTQRLFDVLLNRGQESFSFTDANGNFNKTTKFGYGTFWPSNNMHNTIDFPEIPKIPEAPNEKKFNNRKKYEEALERYNKKKENYNRDLQNYKLSVRLKPFSTFHHLFVLYDGNSKEPNFIRWKKYMEADIQNKWLQELYKIELENENKID